MDTLTTAQQRNYVPLALVLIIGTYFVLQTYHLSTNPPGFFCDEASKGVSAHAIVHTLRDEHGECLPLFLKAVGVYVGCFYFYATIPSILIGGLTVFAVRFTSVWLGGVMLLFAYLLGKELFRSRTVGILSSLFLFLSPWFMNYSRNGMEYISLPAILEIVVFCFAKSRTNGKYFIPAMIFSGIIFYTHISVFLSFPPFFLLLFILYGVRLLRRHKVVFITGVLLFALLAGPALYEVSYGGKGTRASEISGPFTQWAKEGALLRNIARLHAGHFSYDLLFKEGPADLNLRNAPYHTGLLPYTFIPFLIIGYSALVFRAGRRQGWGRELALITLWLMLYPAGGVFSGCISDNRSIFGLGVFPLISAFGFVTAWQWMDSISIFKKLRVPIVFALTALSLLVYESVYFLGEYHRRYIIYAEDTWQWGAEQVLTYYKGIDKQQPGVWDDYYLDCEGFNAPEIFLNFFAPGMAKVKIGNLTSYDDHKRQLFALLKKINLSPRFEGIVVTATIESASGERTYQIVELPGFKNIPREWLIKGPVDVAASHGLPEEAFDTSGWKNYRTYLGGIIMDFPEIKVKNASECYYYAIYFDAPDTPSGQIRIGMTRGITLWLNGARLIPPAPSSDMPVYLFDNQIFPAQFNPAGNQIMVKVCSADRFTFRITDAQGNNLQGIHYRIR